IPGLAGEEGGGDAAAAERRRAFFARAAADHDRHDAHVRLLARRGVWRDPADAADRARIAGSAGADQGAGRRPADSAGQGGGRLGRIILAILVVLIVSRRALIRLFQVPGLVLMPIVFGYAAIRGMDMLKVGMFLAGLCTVAQLSFWGNYLPRVYPVHLRGTGE